MSKVHESSDVVKKIIDDHPRVGGIKVIINDYGTELINDAAAKVLNDKGLVAIIYFYSTRAFEKGPNISAQVTIAIVENPVQRERYISALDPDTDHPEWESFHAPRVVSELVMSISGGRKNSCGLGPITLGNPSSERILAEGGRVQFDVRVNVPSSTASD